MSRAIAVAILVFRTHDRPCTSMNITLVSCVTVLWKILVNHIRVGNEGTHHVVNPCTPVIPELEEGMDDVEELF